MEPSDAKYRKFKMHTLGPILAVVWFIAIVITEKSFTPSQLVWTFGAWLLFSLAVCFPSLGKILMWTIPIGMAIAFGLCLTLAIIGLIFEVIVALRGTGVLLAGMLLLVPFVCKGLLMLFPSYKETGTAIIDWLLVALFIFIVILSLFGVISAYFESRKVLPHIRLFDPGFPDKSELTK